jgi:hypothetical protein
MTMTVALAQAIVVRDVGWRRLIMSNHKWLRQTLVRP